MTPHVHGPRCRRDHVHGPRCRGGRPVTRLQTRMFVSFGASILVAAFATGVVGMIVHRPPAWVDEERLGQFVGERFADVWDRPERLELLATTMAENFNFEVIVRDQAGQTRIATGRCHRAKFTSPVHVDGALVGEVEGCPRWQAGSLGGRVAALAVFLAVLWMASGLIARRLARPIREVARAATRLGEGDLKTRVVLHRKANREAVILGERFNDMAARIERQLEDQRELLAVVSHELRTPLGHLRILAELAEDAKDDAKRRKHLAEFDRELDEIDALVGELLASARLDFASLQRVELDGAALLAEALERCGCEAPVEGAGVVEADRTLLGRALANLATNAIKHGGGVVLGRVVAADDEIRLEIHDDGPGLSEEALARAFEPFRRDGADDLSRPSLGLGLSLVRRIAEAHGGRAYLDRRPEGGTIAGIALKTT